MKHVTLVYGVTGQTVEFYPPDGEVYAHGAPASAATYKVYGGTDTNDATAKFSGTATLDSTSVVVTSASGYSQTDRRKLTVASGSSFVVGRRYLVSNANGQREIVTVAEAATSTLTLEEDLTHDYAASTSTVKGLRQTFAVDATFVGDSSNINTDGSKGAPPYRVEWTYALGSETRKHWSYFDLARQRGKHSVTVDDVRAVWPDILNEGFRGKRGPAGVLSLIEVGWDRVSFDVRTAGVDLDAIRDEQILNELTLRATLWKAAEAGISPAGWDVQTFALEKRNDYLSAFSRAIGTLKAWVDTGNAGGITATPARNLWLRR